MPWLATDSTVLKNKAEGAAYRLHGSNSKRKSRGQKNKMTAVIIWVHRSSTLTFFVDACEILRRSLWKSSLVNRQGNLGRIRISENYRNFNVANSFVAHYISLLFCIIKVSCNYRLLRKHQKRKRIIYKPKCFTRLILISLFSRNWLSLTKLVSN